MPRRYVFNEAFDRWELILLYTQDEFFSVGFTAGGKDLVLENSLLFNPQTRLYGDLNESHS